MIPPAVILPINTHDEIRWYDQDSPDLYLGLTDIDAIMEMMKIFFRMSKRRQRS